MISKPLSQDSNTETLKQQEHNVTHRYGWNAVCLFYPSS